MLNAAKDALASKAAKHYLKGLVARYGELHSISLDSQKKRVAFVCLLHGETEPLRVTVDRYVLRQAGDQQFVEVLACSCDRPWVHRLLEDYAIGRRIELPGWAASAL